MIRAGAHLLLISHHKACPCLFDLFFSCSIISNNALGLIKGSRWVVPPTRTSNTPEPVRCEPTVLVCLYL